MPHIRPHQSVIDLATQCFVEDIPITRVLDRCGVNHSTWSRWRRAGTKPWDGTLQKMQAALDELVAERDQKGDRPAPEPSAG